MRYIFLLILLFPFIRSAAQTKVNTSLKKELDSMYKLHTFFITFADPAHSKENADSMMRTGRFKTVMEMMNYLVRLQHGYDSSNLKRIKTIVQQLGYPGKSLVDTPTNEVAFYILQRHLYKQPSEIPQYLPLLKKAAQSHQLPFRLYAEMLDRSLMEQGKEQLYGTQTTSIAYSTGSARGLVGLKLIVWPIKDAATVNDRRKAIGITQTVEQMAKQANIDYKVYTLDEVKKLQASVAASKTK